MPYFGRIASLLLYRLFCFGVKLVNNYVNKLTAECGHKIHYLLVFETVSDPTFG